MSGLYNAVLGQDPLAPLLMSMLHAIQPFAPGRYRDAWIEYLGEVDGYVIRVHTRNGGGNREDYDGEIASMRSHPWYLMDADEPYDSTYASFYFRVDLDTLDAIHAGVRDVIVRAAKDPVDIGGRWQAAIDTFSSMSEDEMAALRQRVADNVTIITTRPEDNG